MMLSVDMHAHPGRFFMRASPPETLADSYPAPDPEAVIADLRAAGVSAAVFSAVADHVILERSTKGLRARREFAPGEAYRDYRRQLAVFNALVIQEGLSPGRTAGDIVSAHSCSDVAAIFAVEGGDFIEDRLDRIDEAAADGVRCVTIVHYHTNQIGDSQTSEPVNGGLTPVGKKIVAALQDAGIMVDLTHASFETTRDAVAIAQQPTVISHAILRTEASRHPRTLTLEHARLVTENGGLIGAAPFGFGQLTFSDYLDSIVRLVDGVGVAHVAIGTDMDYTYAPVLERYNEWHRIAAGLRYRGLDEQSVADILGGNFMRVFGQVCVAA